MSQQKHQQRQRHQEQQSIMAFIWCKQGSRKYTLTSIKSKSYACRYVSSRLSFYCFNGLRIVTLFYMPRYSCLPLQWNRKKSKYSITYVDVFLFFIVAVLFYFILIFVVCHPSVCITIYIQYTHLKSNGLLSLFFVALRTPFFFLAPRSCFFSLLFVIATQWSFDALGSMKNTIVSSSWP